MNLTKGKTRKEKEVSRLKGALDVTQPNSIYEGSRKDPLSHNLECQNPENVRIFKF